jgi:DNA processing protein
LVAHPATLSSELIYQIALSLLPNIGDVHAKILVEHFRSAEAIFKAKRSLLEKIEGIGTLRARRISHFRDFSRAEEEMVFLDKYKIRPIFLTDKEYPKRLLHCYDSPTILYYKGNADLNWGRIIALIGTRNHSDYGRQVVEKMVRELSEANVMIISGLAYGIDALAHRAAIKQRIPTIGVLGHGLDKMYPQEHTSLAKEMLHQGGLLTEFRSRTKPDKHNFPIRNRIVAGISDCTVVVETGIKGGSMITADLANGYNKDVFAVPGRTSDPRSAGCNELIKQNKAILLTDAAQLIDTMGWAAAPIDPKKIRKQKELFLHLTETEKLIAEFIAAKDSASIDDILAHIISTPSAIAAAILNLELQAVIKCLPGKMYSLL